METFSVEPFTWNHAAAIFSSMLASITKVLICGDDFRKPVSSANRLVKKYTKKYTKRLFIWEKVRASLGNTT